MRSHFYIICFIFIFIPNVFSENIIKDNSNDANRIKVNKELLQFEIDERKKLDYDLKALQKEFYDYKWLQEKEKSEKDLGISQQAMQYSREMMNYFLIVLSIVGLIGGIIGWKTVHDAKKQIKETSEEIARNEMSKAITKMEKEYSNHFDVLKKDFKLQQEEIMDKQKAQQFFTKALFHQEKGDFKDAINSYDSYIQYDKKNFEVYYNKGLCLRKIDKIERAIEMYDKSIELNNKYDDVYSKKGFALALLDKYQLARIECDKAIKLNPLNYYAYTNKGYSLFKYGNTEEANIAFEKSIEISERILEQDDLEGAAYYNIACVCSLQNKVKNAIKNLQKAIKSNNKFKQYAIEEQCFGKNIRDTKEFNNLIFDIKVVA
jgi:tetratricopeptide (TPR) repeat protein